MKNPIKPASNGTKFDKAVKYLVAVPYAFVPLGLLYVAVTSGAPSLGMLAVGTLVVMFALLSAYAIFGERNVKSAIKDAKNLTDQAKDES